MTGELGEAGAALGLQVFGAGQGPVGVLDLGLHPGLSAEQITDLRRWAQAWASDILRRTNAETYEEDDDEPL